MIPSRQILLDAQDNAWLLHLPKSNLIETISGNFETASPKDMCFLQNSFCSCCNSHFFKNTSVASSYIPSIYSKKDFSLKSISKYGQCLIKFEKTFC